MSGQRRFLCMAGRLLITVLLCSRLLFYVRYLLITRRFQALMVLLFGDTITALSFGEITSMLVKIGSQHITIVLIVQDRDLIEFLLWVLMLWSSTFHFILYLMIIQRFVLRSILRGLTIRYGYIFLIAAIFLGRSHARGTSRVQIVREIIKDSGYNRKIILLQSNIKRVMSHLLCNTETLLGGKTFVRHLLSNICILFLLLLLIYYHIFLMIHSNHILTLLIISFLFLIFLIFLVDF